MNSLEITNNLNELIEHPLCIEVSFAKEGNRYLVEVWHETEGPFLHSADGPGAALWVAVEHFRSLPIKDEE